MGDQSRILVVDDEEVILDSCTQILAGNDYLVTTASDGATGLILVDEFRPDLVFIDLKMPGLPGIQALEKISDKDPTIVTVVITGYATVGSAVEAMKKGAYDFLPKPFTPDEFRLITRRGLEKRKLLLETIALRKEKEMLREHFAHIVSHELKAPLGAIQQNLFALEFELSDVLNAAQKGKLERAKIRIDDLLKLINSWLKVISVDSEQLKENFVEVSVKNEISRAIEILAPYAARKDIQILNTIDERLSPVNGDGLSLSEVFVNILGNAIKYSHDGGKVFVDAKENQTNIVISIKDQGIGISKEDLPHIFEGFYRGKAGQAAASGQGIGLSISRQIVEAHDGSINVESEPGAGTTFYVRLPKSKTGSPKVAGSI